MKRTILILSGMAVGLCGLLAALLYEPVSDYEEDAKRFVCIITPEAEYYWGNVKAGIAQADQDLGTYTKLLLFERFDIEKQVQLLEETEYMHVDGIITLGEPYAPKLNEKIREITEKGVPVVLMDRDSKESGRNCYIGSDNYQAGLLAAEWILQETGGHAQIIVFITGEEDANQQERLSGFQDGIAGHEGAEILEICENQVDKTALLENLERIREQYETLNAMFCAEAYTSQQVSLWLQNEKIDNLKVVGFDDLYPVIDCVEKGILSASIVQKAYEIGYQAVEQLESYSSGRQEKQQEIYTDVICVTGDNVEEYLLGTTDTQTSGNNG